MSDVVAGVQAGHRTRPSAQPTELPVAQPTRKLLLGLIGSGIQLSLTPQMHEHEGAAQGFRIHYQLIDLDAAGADVGALPDLLRAARIMGFRGLNVTYPCKQTVLPLLDEVAPDAARIGAVNTVVFREGRSCGHNTDVSGWSRAFRRSLPQADLSHVVVIGAGGAGAAVAHALAALGAERLSLTDPVEVRARELAESLRRSWPRLRASPARMDAQLLASASGVVQSSPVGMSKLPGLPADPSALPTSAWVSDVIYFPIETEFLRRAREHGCRVMDGGEMAVGQAVDAFELFTGAPADEARMRQRFHELLRARG